MKASAAAAARYEERPLPLQMSQTGSTIGAKTASCAKATKDTNQPLPSLALSAPGPRHPSSCLADSSSISPFSHSTWI